MHPTVLTQIFVVLIEKLGDVGLVTCIMKEVQLNGEAMVKFDERLVFVITMKKVSYHGVV